MEFKEQLINYVNQLISYEINLIDFSIFVGNQKSS